MRMASVLIASVVLWLCPPCQAGADEVLDQSFLLGVGSRANFGGISYAQTFTVGVGGTLSRVVVEVIQLENVSVQILATESGQVELAYTKGAPLFTSWSRTRLDNTSAFIKTKVPAM